KSVYPFETTLYLIKWYPQSCICTRFCLYGIDDIFPSAYCKNIWKPNTWRAKPKGLPTFNSIESFNQRILPIVTSLPSSSCNALISFLAVFFTWCIFCSIQFGLFRCHFVSNHVTWICRYRLGGNYTNTLMPIFCHQF